MKKVSSVTSSPSKLSPKEEMERNQLHENICRKLSDTNSSYESNVDPHSRFTKGTYFVYFMKLLCLLIINTN